MDNSFAEDEVPPVNAEGTPQIESKEQFMVRMAEVAKNREAIKLTMKQLSEKYSNSDAYTNLANYVNDPKYRELRALQEINDYTLSMGAERIINDANPEALTLSCKQISEEEGGSYFSRSIIKQIPLIDPAISRSALNEQLSKYIVDSRGVRSSGGVDIVSKVALNNQNFPASNP